MGGNGVSGELLAFINEYIHSVEQAEILVLLKSNPERTWTTEQIQFELRSTLESVGQWLGYCTNRGLVDVSTTGTYKYSPHPKNLKPLNDFCEEFRIRKNRLIDAIYSKPKNQALILAEAFKWKRDDNVS